MKRLFTLAGALAGLILAPPAAQADPQPILAAFQGCWRGEGAGGMTDVRCVAPMEGGQFTRDAHRVGGSPYGGETIYHRDPRTHRLSYTYYASDGGVMRGEADEAGELITFPSADYISATGETITLRSSWRRTGPDTFEAISEALQNGAWREHLRLRYSRINERPVLTR